MSYKSHHRINVGAKAPYCTNVVTATCIPIKTKKNLSYNEKIQKKPPLI